MRKKWYLMLGVGALVCGLVIGAIPLLVHRHLFDGDSIVESVVMMVVVATARDYILFVAGLLCSMVGFLTLLLRMSSKRRNVSDGLP
jgi:hypothetical protein